LQIGSRIQAGALAKRGIVRHAAAVTSNFPSLRLSGLVLALAAGTSCRTLRDGGDPDALAAEAPQAMKIPVGTVHLAQPGSGFVLIRTARFLPLEAGTKLTSVNAQGVETAWLEASEARKGSFLTADVLGGTAAAGEQVLMDYQAPRPGAASADDPFGRSEERQILE